MDHSYLHREQCPFCAASTAMAAPVFRSDPPGEAIPWTSHGPFLSGCDAGRVFFTYYRCSTCQGLYCPTYYTAEQLEALYRAQPANMYEAPLHARKATQREYFDVLVRHADVKGNYLEVGPDIGLFLEICARNGEIDRFYLFEPNQRVHADLAARLSGRNVSIFGRPLLRHDVPDGSVSVAVGIHVIDHVTDPAGLLADMGRALDSSGALLLVTHDERSLLARVMGRRWPPYTLQHPQLFSPQSMGRLLTRCGFVRIECAATRNHFPVGFLIRSALAAVGINRKVPGLNCSHTVALKLGNMAVVAKKST